MPTDLDPDKWTLAGVAAVLSLKNWLYDLIIDPR